MRDNGGLRIKMENRINNKIMFNTKNSDGVFFYLCFLTGFFLLLELSFFIECNKIYLSDFTFITDNLVFPLSILPGILYFLLAQLMVHTAYCICIWSITVLIAH